MLRVVWEPGHICVVLCLWLRMSLEAHQSLVQVIYIHSDANAKWVN